MKKNLLKFSALFLCLVAVSVAGVTIARYYTIADIPAPDQTPHMEVYLRGKNFKPEQTYLLTFENGDQIEIQATKDGEINSSQVLPYKLGVREEIRMDFDEKDSVNIDTPSLSLVFDTNHEKLTWEGRFFIPTEQVNFSITNNKFKKKDDFKADWNGNFKHDISYAGINIIKESVCLQADQSGQELCVSFGVRRAPEITQVLTIGPSTPGGASDDPFTPFDNWTIPSDCDPGPFGVTLSLCNSSHVAGLQEDLSKAYYDFTRMTLQLSAGMMQQVGFIGTLFDAKHQLETQLLFWEKQERAHDDYHPSEQLCAIASMTKGLAAIEARRELNTFVINRALSYEDQNPANTNSAEGRAQSFQIRTQHFKETYCTPTNLNSSLRAFCAGLSAGNVARMNRDVDYGNLLSIPKTLDIDVTDGVDSSADEQDVMAMGRLLFGNTPIEWPQPDRDVNADDMMNDAEFTNRYQEYRSISAIRNVARHSYANLVGMKSEGTGFVNTEIQGLLAEFGMTPTDIERFAGENPSYFAQMHMLTKQIYQHPNFYSNLITKEANISRFETTMEAMQLMSKRDRYETALRKELLLSLMIEMKLRDLQEYGVDVDLRDMGSRNLWAR